MTHTLVFYDGHCALCQFWVQFLIRRDRRDIFRFATLDAELARHHGIRIADDANPDTVIVLRKGKLLTHSEAALRLLTDLGGGWALLQPLLLLPGAVRDPVYRWIARNRYRWFGRTETCLMPRAEWRHKFIDT